MKKLLLLGTSKNRLFLSVPLQFLALRAAKHAFFIGKLLKTEVFRSSLLLCLSFITGMAGAQTIYFAQYVMKVHPLDFEKLMRESADPAYRETDKMPIKVQAAAENYVKQNFILDTYDLYLINVNYSVSLFQTDVYMIFVWVYSISPSLLQYKIYIREHK